MGNGIFLLFLLLSIFSLPLYEILANVLTLAPLHKLPHTLTVPATIHYTSPCNTAQTHLFYFITGAPVKTPASPLFNTHPPNLYPIQNSPSTVAKSHVLKPILLRLTPHDLFWQSQQPFSHEGIEKANLFYLKVMTCAI